MVMASAPLLASAVAIAAPFPCVSGHVVQAERIGTFGCDFGDWDVGVVETLLSFATAGLQRPCKGSEVVLIVAGKPTRCCSGSAGVFPFGFGGQAIADAFDFAQPIAEQVRFIPRNPCFRSR